MSETPILPVSDEKKSPIAYEGFSQTDHAQEFSSFMNRAESQIAPQFDDGRLDLFEPVQAFNPDQEYDAIEGVAVPPEYVASPKSHANEIDEVLLFRNAAEQVDYAREHTKAIVYSLRRARGQTVVRNSRNRSEFTLTA